MAGGWYFDEEPPTPHQRRRIENSARLADRVKELIRESVANPQAFRVTNDLLCGLHAIAWANEEGAGTIRTRDNHIVAGPIVVHDPPPWQEVPRHLVDAYERINDTLLRGIAGEIGAVMHAAAYTLWRINWIHPFGDGNGRTARALCYIVLCVGLGYELPGNATVPERITWEPIRYGRVLKDADNAWAAGRLDVGTVEIMLADLVEQQITS